MNGTIRMTRRQLLALVGATTSYGALAVVLAGCAQPTPTPTPSPAAPAQPVATAVPTATPEPTAAPTKAPVELTMWHGWPGQWETMVKSVADSFNEKGLGVTVKAELVGYGEIDTKLRTAVAAGTPPDLVTLFGTGTVPEYATAKIILPLEDLLSADDIAAAKQWLKPEIYKMGEWEGKVYGFCYWAGASCLGYSKDAFTAAGLDPEKPPKTWNELDDYTAELTKIRSDGEIEQLGFNPWEQHLYLWGAANGGHLYTPDRRTITVNSPENLGALEWMIPYSRKYDPMKVQSFIASLGNNFGADDPLITGRYAMQMIGPFKLGDIAKFGEEGKKYGIAYAPMPEGREGEGPITNTWGDIVIIPKGSKEPKGAALFAMHVAGVNDAEGYAKRVVYDGTGYRPINVPVNDSVMETSIFKQVLKEYPGYEVFIKVLKEAKVVVGYNPLPIQAFFGDRLQATIDAVRLLQKEPKPALDALAAETQAELDKWYEEHSG